MKTKKLNNASFWLILAGLVGSIIARIVRLIITKNNLRERLNEYLHRFTDEQLDKLARFGIGIGYFTAIIVILFCVYFIYRIVVNRTQKQGQKYITFLFVISIIDVVFSILRISWANLFGIAISTLIIVGCIIQSNYAKRLDLFDDEEEVDQE